MKICVRSQRWNKLQNGKRLIQSQPAGGDVDVGVAPKGKPIWKPVTWTCLVFLHIETFPASNSRFGCLAQPRAQEWDSLFFTPEMLARDPNARDTKILYGKIPKDTSRNSTKR